MFDEDPMFNEDKILDANQIEKLRRFIKDEKEQLLYLNDLIRLIRAYLLEKNSECLTKISEEEFRSELADTFLTYIDTLIKKED